MTKGTSYLLFGLGAAIVYIYFATQKKNSLSINGQNIGGVSYNGITGQTSVNVGSWANGLMNTVNGWFSKPITASASALTTTGISLGTGNNASPMSLQQLYAGLGGRGSDRYFRGIDLAYWFPPLGGKGSDPELFDAWYKYNKK